MGRPKKEALTFEGKVQKEMPEFAREVAGLDVQALKNRIAKYAGELSKSEEQQENDEALITTKAEAKELGAPYREVKKAVATKTRYLLGLIEEKGGQ
jgi:hypothetical protein